jgi:cytidylate kinase
MATITISRQFGSGGDEIAKTICAITGYRLFDKHILARAASESGLSDHEIVDYSEENFKVKNFLDRLLGRSLPLAQVQVWKEDLDGVRTVETISITEEHAFTLARRAVEFAYLQGNMVIVGRGGQVILGDRPDVLHVRVEASLEDRLLRVRAYFKQENRSFNTSVEARRAAQNLMEASDAASAEYLRRFFDVDWADSHRYHLTINTSKFDIEPAARTIIEAARLLSSRQLETASQPA